MSAQICEWCENRHKRCYCSPNSTCDKFKDINIEKKNDNDELQLAWETYHNMLLSFKKKWDCEPIIVQRSY